MNKRLICMRCCAMVVESESEHLLGIENEARTLQKLWVFTGGSTLD